MGLPLLAAVKELRLVDLKAELDSRNLVTSGVKAVLVNRLHAAMEEEGMKPDDVRKLKKEQRKQEHEREDETAAAADVQPEDSVSQHGSRMSHRSHRSSAGSVHSAADEEIMRSAARKAGLLAKMEALRSQADEESKLQSLIQELELKKQQGALMAQLAEEEAQQKIYAQCRGSRAGSVVSALAAAAPHQHLQAAQTLNAEAPAFQPQMARRQQQNAYTNQDQEHREEQAVLRQPQQETEEPKLLEVLLQATEKAQLPPVEVVKFRGDPAEYFTFIRSFDSRIGSKHISDQDKLFYLQQYTEGQPHDIVRGCLLMPPEEGYQEARRLLRKRYGKEENISAAHIEKLLTWPNIKADNITSLQNFAVAMMVCDSVMTNMPVGLRETDHPRTLRKIVEKLPFHLHDRWRRVADAAMENRGRRVTFSDLVEFVDREARIAANPLYGRQKMEASRSSSSTKETQRQRTKYGLATSVQVQSSCIYCKRAHRLEDCEALRRKEPDERKKFIQEKGLCFGCLKSGHLAKGCQQRSSCKICGKRHVTLLHQESCFKTQRQAAHGPPDAADGRRTEELNANPQPPQLVKTGCVNQGNTGLAVVPVVVRAGGRTVTTHALLDSGSTACFCQESLLDKLGLKEKNKTQLSLTTVCKNRINIDSQVIAGLQVADLEERHVLQLPAVYSLEKVPVDVCDIPRQQDVSRWSYLSGVRLPHVDAPVELMIGNNVPLAMEPWEVIHSQEGGPFATRTVLGWVINGPVRHVKGSPVKANRIHVQEENVTELFDKLYNAEFSEKLSDETRAASVEDVKWCEKVESSIELKDGHYEVALPLKLEEVRLPRNRSMALRRLSGLKKKLTENKKFKEDYVAFMTKILQENYAEEVPEESVDRADGRVWYIPHHGVYNPHKADKIRVVFDCAARYGDISLNDVLLQGPDLTSSLLGVLLRFRSEPVAFMADVRAMFYQVRVPESDRDLLRFLWWPDGDVSMEPKDYRMNVHIFGAASSPSCSNFALKRTAKDNQDDFSEEALATVRRNFYVDDCLRSLPSVEEAQSLSAELKTLCSRGGFELTKYVSNKEEALDGIPPEDRDGRATEKGLDLAEETRVKKALGVTWNLERDTLGFCVNVRQMEVVTRRRILSVISSVYDPLGVAGPFVLRGKLMLQELIALKIGWDDAVTPSQERKWTIWLEDLPKLEALEVERSLKPEGFGHVVSCQLHHFSDASAMGYGAVSYLRLVNDLGQIHCAIVMAKSRVAPLKKITIPRLELAAAAVAARLNMVIKKELDMKIDHTTFWTDSTAVLRYLRNETARYQVYVANRLAIIKAESSPSQWRFVRSEDNPADDASRGVKAGTLLNKSRWLHGPEFLHMEESGWPPQPEGLDTPEEHDDEVIRPRVCYTASVEKQNPTDKLIYHYSDWHRLKKAVAWMLRYKKYLQTKSLRCHGRDEGPVTRSQTRAAMDTSLLSSAELQEAEEAIIRHVQKGAFQTELQALSSRDTEELERTQKGKINRKSQLKQLDPVLVNGMVAVGGRLALAPVSDNTKHPPILPARHHVTDLIIRHAHISIGHQGREHTLSKLRESYWLIRGSSSVRRVLRTCTSCKKRQAKPLEQEMADLPADRVTPDQPVFSSVGVDLFGPFYVKRGRAEVKRYGVIFTCMATRAVHIEVADSQSTDSFINALRRFSARRGPVRLIRCDNGTNFVGAEKELKAELERLKQTQVHEALLKHGIEWRFNPPTASHFGGAWERQIRTIRKILNSLLTQQTLDDDGLHTLMCEVESILNSRPLTSVSTDSRDCEPLTPNHLLLFRGGHTAPGVFTGDDVYTKRWRKIQYLTDSFWKRWRGQYLPLLQTRQKWNVRQKNLSPGDVVLMVDEALPRGQWPLAKVEEVVKDHKGLVRQAVVRRGTTLLRRPAVKLVRILEGTLE